MSTRAELRQSGKAMRRRLFGNAGDGGREIIRSLNTEAGFGAARHREWIERGFDDGVFLLVGSLQPNLGSRILASNTSRSDLQSRVDTDPIVVEKVVKAEILEIAPAKADTRLDFLLD